MAIDEERTLDQKGVNFELDMGELDRNLGHISRTWNSTSNDGKLLHLVTMTTSLKYVQYKVLALWDKKKKYFF